MAKSEYRIPLPPAYGPPVCSVSDVSKDDPVKYGAYLAGPLGHCNECHTPMVEGRSDYENSAYAGSLHFAVGPDAELVSANITQDVETGIGGWSDAKIAAAVTQDVRPNGSQVYPLMPYGFYASMEKADVDALVAYLRTVKPMVNVVK